MDGVPVYHEQPEERRERQRRMRRERDKLSTRRTQLLLLADQIHPYIQRIRATLAVIPQTTAPVAQVVEYVHRRLGQRGVIFCRSPGQARNLAVRLQQTGLSAHSGNRAMASFNVGSEVDVLVRATGGATFAYNVRFVLHAWPPAKLATYLDDLCSVPVGGPLRCCVILWPGHRLGRLNEVDKYCGARVCRYAQIARLSYPSLVEPEPYEFGCQHCDVCISQPRARTEDDVYRPVMVSFDRDMAGDGTEREVV